MSESTWHLINFDREIGSTYVMDVPGGALYMIKPGKFVDVVEMQYAGMAFMKEPVNAKRWRDLPPQITFVPGASVAIEKEKARVTREAKEAKEKDARDAYEILEEAITSSGNEVIDLGGRGGPVCANIRCPGRLRALVSGFVEIGSRAVSIQGHKFKTEEVGHGPLSCWVFELVQP